MIKLTVLKEAATVMLGSALASVVLAGPVMAQDPAMAATGVPYVVKDQINDGKPIKLEYWEWSGQRAAYQREWASAYTALYPNVEIEIVLQPWNAYWPSLTTNVPAGKGPAMWHMHAAKMTEFCEGELMAPIPSDVADPDYLNEHWIGFAEGAMTCPESTELHTVPMGAMMPILYINDDMWDAAGLTDADIPTTWTELRNVAKTLTQRDGRGRITVAGLSMRPQEFLQNAIYQQGRYIFTKDGKTAEVDNPEYKAALEFLVGLVHEDKALDLEVAGEQEAGFTTGKTAMYMGFSWVTGFINANAEDMNWSAVALPTPDGQVEPAYGNTRFALEAVVNPFASDEEKAVAWDFWHFNYSNEQTVLQDLALFNGFLPPYDGVLDDPQVTDNPVVAVMSEYSEYGVIGDVPEVIRAEQEEITTAVMLDGDDLDGLLKASQSVQNDLLSQREDWNVIERNYVNDGLMIQE